MSKNSYHIKKISRENNFIYLFAALTLLLFSTSLLPLIETAWLNTVVEVIMLLVFLLGVRSLETDSSWMRTVYFLVGLMVILVAAKKFVDNPMVLESIHLLILLHFFIGSFRLSVKQIITSKAVDQNMIIGSIVLYLLLGLIWTIIYLFLVMIYPDAFTGIEAVAWQDNFSHVAYYSFVTLTTLGYGDVLPHNSLAEFFVSAEAIVGVFYMAIIVSSLVSARLESRDKVE